MTTSSEFRQSIHGLLLGTAVGDALGLPAEGLSRQRIERRWGTEWSMRLVLDRGMFSDDTEHTMMVAQSLLAHPNDPVAFQRRLGSKMRWWFLALPAGVGMATARACLKLWCGFPASRSGVRSAGNGPAMRVAIIGAFFSNDEKSRKDFTIAATQITHTDARAEIGARAVAEAAAWIVRREKPFEEFLRELPRISDDEEWQTLCRKMIEARKSDWSMKQFVDGLGLHEGVSGYVFHTVPVAVYACACHPNDFRMALTEALSCGGDTDTFGAIIGGLMGAHVGKEGIPGEWSTKVMEWPRSTRFLETLADRIVQQVGGERAEGEFSYFWLGIIPRNLFFLAVVLCHGLRRLLPPY